MTLVNQARWREKAWNPVRGCAKVSPGCDHCYAETIAERSRGVVGDVNERGFDPRLVPEDLTAPVDWLTRSRVIVCPESDLFQPAVPDAYIEAVARVMNGAYWHDYVVLTKHAGRLRELLASCLPLVEEYPRVWWGVSVEDRKHGLPRIAKLREAPARLRWLSIEPLLEDLGAINLKGIHGVVVGAEAADEGGQVRRTNRAWVRSIRDQCVVAKVPFFFKKPIDIDRMADGRLGGLVCGGRPPFAPGPPDWLTRRCIWGSIGVFYRAKCRALARGKGAVRSGALPLPVLDPDE